VKIRILMLAAIVATASGCATVGGAHALATPWGVGGLYTFKDKPKLAGEPSTRKVDVLVAQALDHYDPQQSANEDVRVASRARLDQNDTRFD
jgi:hypothetical protein